MTQKHDTTDCDCPECVLEERNLLRLKVKVLAIALEGIVDMSCDNSMEDCVAVGLIGDVARDALAAIGEQKP
jgi:hypothetical protein